MHAINWFEIPTTQLGRAAEFYSAVTGQDMKPTAYQDGQIVVFAGGEGAVRGALVNDPKLRPGNGTLVYLNAAGFTGGVTGALERAKKAGGRVIVPRSSIGPMGWIGVFEDSEGNSIGLHEEA